MSVGELSILLFFCCFVVMVVVVDFLKIALQLFSLSFLHCVLLVLASCFPFLTVLVCVFASCVSFRHSSCFKFACLAPL